MITVAVVVGCAGGFGAIAFRGLIALVKRLCWGDFGVPLAMMHDHS